jgi:hypothetical protein
MNATLGQIKLRKSSHWFPEWGPRLRYTPIPGEPASSFKRLTLLVKAVTWGGSRGAPRPLKFGESTYERRGLGSWFS